MKKLLSLALALTIALSCAVALAEADLSQYVSDPSEKVTIAWLAGHDTTEVNPEDPVLLWLNEKFNVEIQPWFIERENYDQLLTTRIMGNEVPDVFMLQDAAQFSKYVKQGVAMELPLEVIEKCMPESYAWLLEYDPECFSTVSYNGKNYGLPRVNGDGKFNYAPFWRADWLAKFGYTDGNVPMTLDECEEVFYQFANEDPDGNGVKDTYALSNTGMNPIYGAFGALPDRWVKGEDGKLVYGAVYPGMKDALELLAKWYADGLIDPEFITGENQGGYWALSVPFENGQIGFSSSGAYYHLAPDFDGDTDYFKYGRTMRTFASTVGYDKMVIGYNPVGYDGKTQGGESWGLTTSEAIVFSYKLKDQPAKLARILEVINTIGSDYDTWLKMWSWDLNTDMYNYDPLLGYTPMEGYSRDTTYGDNHGNMFNTLQNPNFAAVFKPANYNWAIAMPQFQTGGYSNTMLPITTASMPDKWTSMEALRLTTFIQIITGEKSVDDYDEFVAQWYDMGGTDITNEANEWYLSK